MNSPFSCTTEKYDLIYARWLEKPGNLLDLAGYEPGMKLLDLCGGTGAVTKEALRRGASPRSIVLYDLNPRLEDDLNRGVRCIQGRAERLETTLKEQGTFDVIVCRQAIAYIDLQHDPHSLPIGGTFASSIWGLLKPEGRFVFNSFVRPRWSFQAYEYEGNRYIEASGFFGGRVGHLQWCRGQKMDATLFRWHREDTLRRAFERFGVEILRSERSLHWICTRPAPSSVIFASERFRLAR